MTKDNNAVARVPFKFCNSLRMPPTPTLFYNACYFPFIIQQGQAIYKQIQNEFQPSPSPDNAITNILNGLKKASPTIAGLEVC
jgi:hypothetical protein